MKGNNTVHEVFCPHCGQGHTLSDEKIAKYAGKMAQCACGQTFRIEPVSQPVSAAGPPPPPTAPVESTAETSDDEMLHAMMSAPPDAPLEPPQPATMTSPWPDSVGFAPPANDQSSSYAEPAHRRALGYRGRSPRTSRPGAFRDFLEFRRMITVGIVSWVFILGSIALVLGALYAALNIASGSDAPDEKLKLIALSLLAAFVGVAVLRLLCEFAVVVFRINETLTEIKNQRFE
jgi:hypothetical protein